MKLHYYPATDSLYIEVNDSSSADSREIADGLIIDFDANGDIVGIDVDHAPEKLDLTSLETVGVPFPSTKRR